MSTSITDKIIRIMELAMLINPTSTNKELTGDKPTVFVSFSGHCTYFCITVRPEGWEPDYDINAGAEYYEAYLEDDDATKALDKALARLEEIWAEVQEGKYDDTV